MSDTTAIECIGYESASFWVYSVDATSPDVDVDKVGHEIVFVSVGCNF